MFSLPKGLYGLPNFALTAVFITIANRPLILRTIDKIPIVSLNRPFNLALAGETTGFSAAHLKNSIIRGNRRFRWRCRRKT